MYEKNLYDFVYRYLLIRIHFNFFPQGEHLPSIYKLGSLLGVSTMTVREALKRLEQNGYIVCEKNRRTVVKNTKNSRTSKMPDKLLARNDVLQDLYHSMKLIFPDILFFGFLAGGEQNLEGKGRLLHMPSFTWDEPAVYFLAHVIKKTKNSLISELYYDMILFAYPTNIASWAANEKDWEVSYGRIQEELEDMVKLRDKKEYEALWRLINQAYSQISPTPVIAPSRAFHSSAYHWRKPQICLSLSSEIIHRIFYRIYPQDTFLPSARLLSEETSVPVITVRRAIRLLNDLGVVVSVNGKGTKVLPPEKGLEKIKWEDGSVRKNIISYLEALQLLAITVRSVAAYTFPLLSEDAKVRLVESIRISREKGYVEASITDCLNALVSSSRLSALKEVYGQLIELLIWGFPLSYLRPKLNLDQYAEDLALSLEKEDSRQFGDLIWQMITVIFLSGREKAVSVGIEEAKGLKLYFPKQKAPVL